MLNFSYYSCRYLYLNHFKNIFLLLISYGILYENKMLSDFKYEISIFEVINFSYIF